MLLEYISLGMFVGFMSGALGTGGGLLLVPLIASIAKAQGITNVDSFKIAVATSLAVIFFTSLSSVIYHVKEKNLDIKIIYPLMVTTAIGGFLLTPIFSKVIPTNFIIILFITVSLFASKKLFFQKKNEVSQQNDIISSSKKIMLSMFGLPIGGLCGILGVGGGGMTISLLRHFNLSPRGIIASTACLTLPISLSTCLYYIVASWHTLGNGYFGCIYLPAFFSITISGVAFSLLGGKIASNLNVNLLKKFMAIILFVVSIKLIFELLG